MIKIPKGVVFPITVSLFDDHLGKLISNGTVSYDVRDVYGNELAPPVSGTLSESSISEGIYLEELSIDEPGNYIFYATCSGFITNTETIVVYDKYDNYVIDAPHNVFVMDILRTNEDITESQQIRKVGIGKTDYVISAVKRDDDLDWTNPVSSGISYAYYRNIDDDLPYMMGAGV